MTHPLLSWDCVDDPPADFLRGVGEIFATFGPPAQDSGNISYGIRVRGERFFVKTTDASDRPFLPYEDRVALLRNAARLAARVQHRALPRLERLIESPHGPLLVYRWVDGDLLRGPTLQRFRALPAEQILTALDTIYDVHELLAADDWIAEDFYDGCLIYDFPTDQLSIVDLDNYHHGAFVNETGRMFGSSRFMAPEEFERGATIDQRTTVFTLARTALVFLLKDTAFRGSPTQRSVLSKACAPDPADRYDTVAEFTAAWRDAART